MLVSAQAGDDLRRQVAQDLRPCPEFLALERDYGVRLVDWSALGPGPHHRSALLSLQHTWRALAPARKASAVFSDGEHIGIPMAMGMAAARIPAPHLMIGHRLLDPRKARLLRSTGAVSHFDRIIVHSRRQARLVPGALGAARASVALVPYGVDTAFWAPARMAEDPDLVFAAGREHRDYRSLASACAGDPVRVVITDHSAHSPRAKRQGAADWPANVTRVSLTFADLRGTYGKAAVVVVPLVDADFPAGITGALEAMAMGKAVVASATPDMQEVIEHGRTGLLVAPGDVAGLRQAVRGLLGDPDRRRVLGRRAREAVLARHSLTAYAAALAAHLEELSRRPRR